MYPCFDEVKKSARLFYLKLCGNFDGNLDDASTTNEVLRCLPPTEDAFRYHMLHELFQILIYKAAQQNHPNIPAPTSFVREICGNNGSNHDGQASQTSSSDCEAILHMYQEQMHKEMLCAAAGVNCVVVCKYSAKPDKCDRVLDSESDDDE